MTTKKTIIISAATCLVVNLVLYLMGWLVWPLLWVGSGLLLLKLGNFLASEENTVPASIICGALGPLTLFTMIWAQLIEAPFDLSKLNLPKFPKFPKIRNPFFWKDESEVDKH